MEIRPQYTHHDINGTDLQAKLSRLRLELDASYEFSSRLFDQISSLRAAVDMPELYLDEDWHILGYSIHFPGLSRKVVECKDNSAHLSELLRPGDFDKIRDYLARVNKLNCLPYDDGEPWSLVYEGIAPHEKIGADWIPYKHQFFCHWSLENRRGLRVIYHEPHLEDSADCYLISGREYGNEFTDVKIEYKTRTSSNPALIRDLSLVISGGGGGEVILPDLFGYTACTARANAKAGIQREAATMLAEPEVLKPDATYQITVERTGGRISRTIVDESGVQLSAPLVFIDSQAVYNRQNFTGFHTFSGEAEIYDIRVYERKSRFSIDQFVIPFDVEVGICDDSIADHIFKLRLGHDASYGKPMHLLIFEDITQSKRDHQNLARSQKQLRSLSRHLESIREEERARIAREVHDELGQILTALKLDLSWIGLKLDTGQKTLKDKADAMAHNIDSAIRTVQKITGELRPGMLDDLGLEAAIEWQVGKFSEQTGIRCSIDMPSESLDYSKKLAINLFRILQETLTNIARHASASRAWIKLKSKDNKITFTVRDNGVGLPPQKINHPLSLGLTGIRERAIFCGGEIEILSGKPRGTTIKVQVPLETSTDD